MTGRAAPHALAAGGIAAATAVAVLASNGDPAAAVAPALAVAVLWALWRAPLRTCVLAFFFLCILADAPQDNPMSGHWHSPLYPLGQLLCSNWSKTFGVAALSCSGIDLVGLALLARVAVSGERAQMAQPLRAAASLFFVTILALAAVGAAGGGNFDAAYWQVRQLVWLPGFIWLCAHALGEPRDWQRFGQAIVAAAVIKALVGLYFHFFIALPRGLRSPVIVSHSESLLFCLAVTLLFARWVEWPDRPALRRCFWLIPLLLTAIWLNNRRIAYVGLAASGALVWAFTRWNLAKRAVARAALFAFPLAAIYVAAGWGSTAPAFKPVAAIRTVVSPDRRVEEAGADSSTRAREIENFNLSRTLREHPLGRGLGHPYVEAVKGPDISHEFALYRYIPHNDVLWMLTAGGPLGFFLLWSLFATGIFLAARSYRFASTPLHRCAAIASLCAQALFLIQAWGDMGTQNWSAAWLVAAALASAGRLAVETRAWPASATRPAGAPAAA